MSLAVVSATMVMDLPGLFQSFPRLISQISNGIRYKLYRLERYIAIHELDLAICNDMS